MSPVAERALIKPYQAFSITLVAILWQAYATRYHHSHDGKKGAGDKVYTLVTVHLILTLTSAALIWLSFIILISVSAAASQDRGVKSVKPMKEGGVRVSIGPSNWLLLTAAVIEASWVWETLRWRHAEYVK